MKYAKNTETDEEVAIKIIDKEKIKAFDLAENLTKEVKTLLICSGDINENDQHPLVGELT